MSRQPQSPVDMREYFGAIEEHFVRLRGSPLVLSPDDWHLVASWHQQHVPLRLILRALDTVFQTAASRRRRTPVHSLSYCRHAVEKEHRRFLESGPGKSEPTGEPTAKAVIEKLGEMATTIENGLGCCRPTVQETARDIATSLRSAAADLQGGEPTLEQVETELITLERRLLHCLEESLPNQQREAIYQECEKRLASHRERMTPRAYKTTRRRAVEAEIRHLYHLPRLSLLLS